jgi:hypothetical protein
MAMNDEKEQSKQNAIKTFKYFMQIYRNEVTVADVQRFSSIYESYVVESEK